MPTPTLRPPDLADLARRGYNHVPVMREILADLDTPLSAYLKLAAGPYSYLFESVQGGEQWGRYSIIGLPAGTVVKVCGESVFVERQGEVVERADTPDTLNKGRAIFQAVAMAERGLKG